MAIKKIEWQREYFTDANEIEQELIGCPITELDNFAALMVLFNNHIDASDDDVTMSQLYETNEHFKEVTDRALLICGVNLSSITHDSIAELLHSYLGEDGAFYPGRLVQINLPFSKKYRFHPIENMEEEIEPDLIQFVEELTETLEAVKELERINNGSGSGDNV